MPRALGRRGRWERRRDGALSAARDGARHLAQRPHDGDGDPENPGPPADRRRTAVNPAAGALAALAVALGPSAWAAPVELSGFLQADYVRSQESEDQLADGTGAPLNQDRFLVRRARVRAA